MPFDLHFGDVKVDHGDMAEPTPSTDPDVSAPGAPPWAQAGRPSVFRSHPIGVIAVCGLVLLAVWATGTWITNSRAGDYTGQTRSVTLTYSCTNAIFWTDPGSDHRWWAGESPVLPVDFPTSAGGESVLVAGELHFDSATRATFSPDSGGELPMTREKTSTFHHPSCSIHG